MKIAKRFCRAQPCKPGRALIKMYSHLQKAKMRLAFFQPSQTKKTEKPLANDYIELTLEESTADDNREGTHSFVGSTIIETHQHALSSERVYRVEVTQGGRIETSTRRRINLIEKSR